MSQGDDTDRGGWVELTDENGHGYWHNQVTNETSWYDPAATEAIVTDEEWTKLTDENGYEYWHNTVTNETSWYDPAAAAAAPGSAAAAATDGEWTRLKDENGYEYWYNSITKETSWEDWSTAATKVGDAASWTKIKDENGYCYWHNTVTNETSWDDPHASTAADLPTPPPSAAPAAATNTVTMPPAALDSNHGTTKASEAEKGGKTGKGGETATPVIKKRKLPTFLEMLHNREMLSVFEGYVKGREAKVTLAYTTFKCFWQENEALHSSSMISLADANNFFAKFIKSGECLFNKRVSAIQTLPKQSDLLISNYKCPCKFIQ